LHIPFLSESFESGENQVQQTIMEKQRMADIQLLKRLHVKYIFDLMMENRKVKFGLTVSSSEKADSLGRYTTAGFRILSVPYPGVEFFREYKANRYCGKGAH
jgi:myotubularin-related protein 14